MAKAKKADPDENKIREGTEDYAIERDPKSSKKDAYPKLNEQEQQYKDQAEFIDNEPNKKDKDATE